MTPMFRKIEFDGYGEVKVSYFPEGVVIGNYHDGVLGKKRNSASVSKCDSMLLDESGKRCVLIV